MRSIIFFANMKFNRYKIAFFHNPVQIPRSIQTLQSLNLLFHRSVIRHFGEKHFGYHCYSS